MKPKILILSGAGLSADSGIPTFRGADGLWENHHIDVVANGCTWRQNWDTVRNFYNDRRKNLATVLPNPAHHMIADWQQKYDTTVLTQNIDDLLERAGCQDVVHLHGKLTEMRCVACGTVWDVGYEAHDDGDRCAKCNSRKGLRPNVIFFNEHAPLYAVMYRKFRELRSDDVVIVAGTSGQVVNVDAFVSDFQGLKILNNLEPGDSINESYYDHVFYGKASLMFKQINIVVDAYMSRKEGLR